VSDNTTVTITATYNGVSRTASLTVTPPPLEARFTVTGGRGPNTCEVKDSSGELDCELNGSGSSGSIAQWRWRLRLGDEDFSQETTTPIYKPSPNCSFLENGGDAGDDGSVSMQISLRVVGRNGQTSSELQRSGIKLFRDGNCLPETDDDDDDLKN
jgi:hypothetical protein